MKSHYFLWTIIGEDSFFCEILDVNLKMGGSTYDKIKLFIIIFKAS